MSNTLPQLDYTTTSNSTGIVAQEISIVLSDDINNMTMGATGSSYLFNTNSVGTITLSGTGGSYTIGSGDVTTITLDDISASEYNWKHSEWEDCFPDFDRIKAMCNHYPGLQIAFEKFKTVYKLVKDDYDNPKD